jgi:hypothetical protein
MLSRRVLEVLAALVHPTRLRLLSLLDPRTRDAVADTFQRLPFLRRQDLLLLWTWPRVLHTDAGGVLVRPDPVLRLLRFSAVWTLELNLRAFAEDLRSGVQTWRITERLAVELFRALTVDNDAVTEEPDLLRLLRLLFVDPATRLEPLIHIWRDELHGDHFLIPLFWDLCRQGWVRAARTVQRAFAYDYVIGARYTPDKAAPALRALVDRTWGTARFAELVAWLTEDAAWRNAWQTIPRMHRPSSLLREHSSPQHLPASPGPAYEALWRLVSWTGGDRWMFNDCVACFLPPYLVFGDVVPVAGGSPWW